MKSILSAQEYEDKSIYHLTGQNPQSQVNSALLVGAFMILELEKKPRDVVGLFSQQEITFLAY